MGNWQLEVGKFAIYMMFPVASFYAYHQVEIFGQNRANVRKDRGILLITAHFCTANTTPYWIIIKMSTVCHLHDVSHGLSLSLPPGRNFG